MLKVPLRFKSHLECGKIEKLDGKMPIPENKTMFASFPATASSTISIQEIKDSTNRRIGTSVYCFDKQKTLLSYK